MNCFIILFCFSLIYSNNVSNYNSIYNFSKNARIHSLSNIHLLSNSVSGLFYQPISNSKNIKGDTYFAYLNQYNNMDIIQFGYCLKHDRSKNISVGFISRDIKNMYNTTNAWIANDLTIPPQFDEIDYNMITNLEYEDYGFIISYNKYLKNSILNYKIKPFYNSIESNYALGLDVDMMYYRSFKRFGLIFGIDDLLSYKKWSSGTFEKNNINYFISGSMVFNNINMFLEYSNIYFKRIGIEYNIKDMLFCRLGIDSYDNLTYGVGLNSEVFELNYAYLISNDVLGNIYQISIILKLDGLLDLKDDLSP